MTSIPKFPYPDRKYVFEVDSEILECDNEYIIYIGVKKIFDKGEKWDDGSNYDMECDEFYEWMDEVGKYLSIEIDNLGDGAWQAVDYDSDEEKNRKTKLLLEFLRKHPNFVEVGENAKKLKKVKVSAGAEKLNSDQIKEKIYDHIVNECPMSVWDAEYRDRLHLDFIKNLSLEEYKRKQLEFERPCKNLAKKTAKSFERVSKKKDKTTGNWVRAFRLCLVLMDHTAYVTTDPDDRNILKIEYVRDRPCFNPDHSTRLESNESVKPVTPPVSDQAPPPVSEQEATEKLHHQMVRDFMREMRAAECKYMSLSFAVSRYMTLQFQNDFLAKHPEYVPFIDDIPTRDTSKEAHRYAALFANSEFVTHLETLMKLCIDFKPEYDAVDD